MLKDYDFHLVYLSCSFLPTISSRFEWVRLGVQLLTESKDAKIKPIVYDAFPSEILKPLVCEKSINVDSELMLRPDIRKIESVADTSQYIIYQPIIISNGLSSSTIVWNFKKADERGIFGDSMTEEERRITNIST